MTDLPFGEPLTPATPNVSTRRCARHDWREGVITGEEAAWTVTECRRCGKVRDEDATRRNRRNARRGKAIQRARIVGLGGQNLPGNKPNHDGIGLAFGYESKSGGSFSQRYWRWLKGIPVKGDQTAVLIVTETPGPGHVAKSYVVVDYDDWRDLHGEGDA